jgi:glutamate dehydrogenase
MTTTRAETEAELEKSAKIDQVVRAVRSALPAEQAEGAQQLVRRLFSTVTIDDVLSTAEEDLVGAALSLWRFAERRGPGESKVRVFNPSSSEEGWAAKHTVVEIVNDDMPFLVSSISAEIHRRGLDLHLVLHPVLGVRRGAGGERLEVTAPDATGVLRESLMHLEIDQETSRARLEELAGAFTGVLEDVGRVVGDWGAMRERVHEVLAELETDAPPLPEDELDEGRAFLDWMAEDHFTFLGYREYALVDEGGDTYLRLRPESGLGLLRQVREDSQRRSETPLAPAIADFLRRRELLIVTKTHARSPVHRPVAMDYIAVRRFDEDGRVVGERRFLGLFSSAAYHKSVLSIPLLRQKVSRIVERVGFHPRSHDARTLRHLLETFPRDELFQISDDDLYDISLGILRLQERQRVTLFVRRDPFERFVSALVYVPRDRHNTELRLKMEEILAEAFGGTTTAFSTQLGDQPLARAHFIFQTDPGEIPPYDVRQLEERLAHETRTWADRLRRTLVEAHGEEKGLAVLRRYEDAFPGGYREALDADDALLDIECAEVVIETGELNTRLDRARQTAGDQVRFRVFHPEPVRPLSDLLPMLEDMGLKVVWEVPYEVRPRGVGKTVWIRDFLLAADDATEIDLAGSETQFRQAFARVWSGDLESDGFNRLVVSAGLDWREVTVLRAYGRYLRQVGIAFSQEYMAATLDRSPLTAKLLIELFRVRFDPAHVGRETDVEELQARVKASLASVTNLDEDRILRRFFNLVRATVRTNFFQAGADGEPKPYLSFKLDGRRVRQLPAPKPRFEVWVYSPRVEAVHLRGGRVARGGIRWSDRRQDFRTEILGLIKAQMVKNAVIVPVGAKGGFIVKRSPQGLSREEWLAEGVECYRTMIRGLLDVTDNLVAGELVPPVDVVRHDRRPDPYLVVAADKGTATFSDVANGLSAEYGFWLADAFASGGSAGYDHKAMGITARGAWESVKRHFRELGKDTQSEDFTVVGVGDMGGDVFGNGMLLSEHIRLVGAFNHVHVFVDPDPDPAVSFAERRRLFDTPRSTWADYDAAKLSAGGAVYERSAKSVTIGPEAQERFGLNKTHVTPDELIQALLRAPADLLWFGGIGTFVKASTESHGDAGDRVNDDVRVDASELTARVIGEGANLGLTQRARVEFAQRGGKINTDAIDNSAGVDTSDHEVNIKILFGEVMARGEMTLAERDALLAGMTDEVAELVLRDNYLQTQAISVAESSGVALLDQQARLMRNLERAGKLVRSLEHLPGDEEVAERQAAGRGLTRPEIAVLLAYAKIALYQEILRSDLPDDPELENDLLLYFPEPLREGFRDAVAGHRLRREIIATHVTNSTVNRVGATFVTRLAEETGAGATEIARAYTIVRDAFDLRRVWGEIEALDNRVPAGLQVEMIQEVARLVDRSTLWLLRHARQRLDVKQRVAEFGRGAFEVLAALEEILSPAEREVLDRRMHSFEERGVPGALARFAASVDLLGAVLDIVTLSEGRRFGIPEVARVYFQVGSRFRLDWLRAGAAEVADQDPWHKAAAEALAADLMAHQGEIARSVLADAGEGQSADDATRAWLEARRTLVEPVDRLIEELAAAAAVDLAMLTVANHHLRLLAEEG